MGSNRRRPAGSEPYRFCMAFLFSQIPEMKSTSPGKNTGSKSIALPSKIRLLLTGTFLQEVLFRR